MSFKSKLIISLAALSMYSAAVFAESTDVVYRHPLAIPVSLSGNFGEIRSTHFHSGIDIKTQGVEGQKLYAVADGYISRVSVSPTGYGKAIYVTHPKLGTMTVNGHLQGFMPELATFVKDYQYRHKKFKVDLYPTKDRFKVKQGDIIGYTGNSGSSGGPHLHFEVRDAATSETLNPIVVCDIKVADIIPPKIVSVTVVELDYSYGIPIHIVKKRYPTTSVGGGKYTLSDTIKVSRDCYFAFEVTEQKSGTSNIFGVSSLKLSTPEREIWGYDMDRLSFGYGRATYNMLLYPETTKTRNDIIRTYVSSTNRLAIYSPSTAGGIISKGDVFASTLFTLVAADEHGNSSSLAFTTVADTVVAPSIDRPKGRLVFADSSFSHTNGDMRLYIPSYALQQSMYTPVTATVDSKYRLSKVVEFAKGEAPFTKKATLAIKAQNITNINPAKLLITFISEEGEETSVGGTYRSGFVSTTVNGGGQYRVSADTIAPKITPLQSKGVTLKSVIGFKITDDLSGIYKYDVYIDDKWILFDYDAKKSKIVSILDPTKITKGGRHSCKVIVNDTKGNKSTHNTSFIW